MDLQSSSHLGGSRGAETCVAASVSAGRGVDDPPPEDAAKADLRRALGWLPDKLAAWSKVLDSDDPQARAAVAPTLRHWRKDSDLVGLREPEALAALPAKERADWQALWGEVDRMIAKA